MCWSQRLTGVNCCCHLGSRTTLQRIAALFHLRGIFQHTQHTDVWQNLLHLQRCTFHRLHQDAPVPSATPCGVRHLQTLALFRLLHITMLPERIARPADLSSRKERGQSQNKSSLPAVAFCDLAHSITRQSLPPLQSLLLQREAQRI